MKSKLIGLKLANIALLCGSCTLSRSRMVLFCFSLHEQVLYKAVYRCIGNNISRRSRMERLHLIHDDKVPDDLMVNVSNQIKQLRPVPKSIGEYSEEELAKFPKLFDFPDEHVPK